MAAATTIKCHFTKNTIFSYLCEIRDVELVNGVVTFEHFNHQKGKTDADVKMISFIKSTVHVVPNHIFKMFPNLEVWPFVYFLTNISNYLFKQILDLMDVKMVKWNRDFSKGAKNLKRIWLAKNQISEIEDNSFLGATGLEYLVMFENKISKIGEKAFNGLFQLKSLELQNNLITSLVGNVFAPLKKLSQLNLSQNEIVNIDDNVFNSNSKLEFLNLNTNNLTELGENIFKNQINLTVVHLQNNKINKLHSRLFFHCEMLMDIAINNNELKEIPADIFANNKRFKSLNAMNNPIEKFDGKFLPPGMELLYLGELTRFQIYNVLKLKFSSKYWGITMKCFIFQMKLSSPRTSQRS